MLTEHLLCARDCAEISCPCLILGQPLFHHWDDWGTGALFTALSKAFRLASWRTAPWQSPGWLPSSIQPRVLPDPCQLYSSSFRPHTARASDAVLPVATSAGMPFPALPSAWRVTTTFPHLANSRPSRLTSNTHDLFQEANSERCISRQCCSSASSLDLWPRGPRPVSSVAPQAQSHYSKMWNSIMSLPRKSNPFFGCSHMWSMFFSFVKINK